VRLPLLPLGAAIIEDYRVLGLSLKAHPLALLRARLREQGILPAAALAALPDGKRVTLAGLVLIRQRPGTASGVVFATIEDETGVANIIIWPALLERFRRAVLGARLLCVQGKLQREGVVMHVVGDRFVDLSGELQALAEIDAHRPARVADALPEARNFR
jgi:error-prone DNA polymerase